MNLANGLLGLGGLGAINSQSNVPGLLGKYYNTSELNKAKTKQGLLQAGIALLSQQPRVGAPYGFGETLGTALRGGLEGAQQAQADYMNNAKFAYDLNRQATMDDRASQEWQRKLDSWKASDAQKAQLQEIIKTLDPEMQAAAKADPETFFKEYSSHLLKQKFPDNKGTKSGLQLTYWRTKDGVLHAGQLQDSGGVVEVPLPEGSQWAPGMSWLDTGTGYTPVGKHGEDISGVAPIGKDLAGAERQKKIGEQQGAAQADLPGEKMTVDYVNGMIDDVINDPDLKSIAGYASYLPAGLQSNAMIRVNSKLNQLSGQAFLQARQVLKGGGAISDTESKAAEQAYSRLQMAVRASDPAEITSALNDFKTAVNLGYQKLQARSGQVPTPTQPAPSPLGNDPLGLR